MSKKSTLITEKELERRCRREGIDFSKVCVLGARWAESTPKKKGVRSALVRCDLIVRDDGSAVGLDGAMAHDSLVLFDKHTLGKANPENLEWDEYVKKISLFPKS